MISIISTGAVTANTRGLTFCTEREQEMKEEDNRTGKRLPKVFVCGPRSSTWANFMKSLGWNVFFFRLLCLFSAKQTCLWTQSCTLSCRFNNRYHLWLWKNKWSRNRISKYLICAVHLIPECLAYTLENHIGGNVRQPDAPSSYKSIAGIF